MATLPPAVQAQLEAAERMEQALQAQTSEHTPAEQTPAEPEPQQTAPSTPEQTTAPANPPPAPEPQAGSEWKQKYDTLAGKYTSEVPTLQRQLRDSESQRQQMLAQLNELTRKVSELSAPKPQEVQTQAIDPKDAENFGADLVEMVSRVATSVVGAKVDQVVERLSRLEQQLTGVAKSTSTTAEQAFATQLTMAVPDWQAVNAQPEFLAWLQEADPVYGITRQQSLDDAAARLDLGRVVAVFKAFAASRAPVQAVQTPPSDLARQVAPATAPAVSTPVAATPGALSVRDIEQFYDAVRRGEYRGREQDVARREAEINAAIATGRLVP